MKGSKIVVSALALALWLNTVGGLETSDGNKWNRVTASATLERCRVRAKDATRELHGLLKGTGRWDVVEQDLDVHSVSARNKTGERVSGVFQCWPDTVDPRGPKGK